MMKVRSTPKEHHASYVQVEKDSKQTTSQSMVALREKRKLRKKRELRIAKKEESERDKRETDVSTCDGHRAVSMNKP